MRVTDPSQMAALIIHGLTRDHHYFEKMARAVQGPPAQLPHWHGERIDADFVQELAIAVYRPRGERCPVVAFGNTRLPPSPLDAPIQFLRGATTFVRDVASDIFPLGVGCDRYCLNEGRIKRLLEGLVRRHQRRVVVTGHSLGGSMAMLAGLRLPEFVEAVVTFQAPAVSGWVVRAFYDETPSFGPDLEHSSTHYRISGDDLIQQTGEQASPGQAVELELLPECLEWPPAYHAHVAEVFDGFARTNADARAVVAAVRRRLASLETTAVGALGGDAPELERLVLEWLRANAANTLIGLEGVLLGPRTALTHSAIPLMTAVVYVLAWVGNVRAVRANPNHDGRVDFRQIAIAGEPVSLEPLLGRDHVRGMQADLRRYAQRAEALR